MMSVGKLLEKSGVDSSELEELLALRDAGEVKFLLIDVREKFEFDAGHIKGVDMLKPSSKINLWTEDFLQEYKDKVVIFTCRTDNRSGKICKIFNQYGLKSINHLGGIVSYKGEIEN